MRGAALRSGLVAAPPGGQLPDSLAGSALPSKAVSPAVAEHEGTGGGQAQPAGLPCVRSPDGTLISRDYDEARVAAELAVVRDMWEMAAALDFLALFSPQVC